MLVNFDFSFSSSVYLCIAEDVLRGLMNLAIARANEDIIRQKGGIEELAKMLKSTQWEGLANSKLLYQAVRVLVNLSCNSTPVSLLRFFD